MFNLNQARYYFDHLFYKLTSELREMIFSIRAPLISPLNSFAPLMFYFGKTMTYFILLVRNALFGTHVVRVRVLWRCP